MRPYYEDAHGTIYHANCLEVLPRLPKADLLLTDPPYLQSKSGGGMIKERPTYQDIGNSLSNFAPDDYWPALYECTKTRHGYIFMSKNLIGYFLSAAERNNLSWDLLLYGKNNPTPLKNNRYLSSFEFLFFFRGQSCFFNNDAPFEYYSKLKMVNCEPAQYGHPTEKNVGVLMQLLTVSTKANDCIIDPFMGSGTTLRAAKNLGRKYIGIEIEEKYCEMTVRRLSQEVLL